MALPMFRKYVVVNNSGQTLTYNNNGRITIKETAIYYNTTTGKLVSVVLDIDDLGFIAGSTLADGAEIVGDVELDNSSLLYISSHVYLEVTHDEGSAADGTFEVYISSGNVTGELETDASGYDGAETNRLTLIGQLIWHSGGVDDEIIRSPKMSVG